MSSTLFSVAVQAQFTMSNSLRKTAKDKSGGILNFSYWIKILNKIKINKISCADSNQQWMYLPTSIVPVSKLDIFYSSVPKSPTVVQKLYIFEVFLKIYVFSRNQ